LLHGRSFVLCTYLAEYMNAIVVIVRSRAAKQALNVFAKTVYLYLLIR
jgi:hypothetical protein